MTPRLIATCLGLAGLAAAVAAQTTPPYDTILRHGTVIDGSGLSPIRADVALRGDHVAAVGNLAKATASTEIDVAGLYVTPGFINIHSHASAPALPRAENMLTQGVTTEVMNADGGGPTDLAAQGSRLAASGLAVNVGAYIGFNSIWSGVVGPDNRRPSEEDIERMRSLVIKGMEDGAWGVWRVSITSRRILRRPTKWSASCQLHHRGARTSPITTGSRPRRSTAHGRGLQRP